MEMYEFCIRYAEINRCFIFDNKWSSELFIFLLILTPKWTREGRNLSFRCLPIIFCIKLWAVVHYELPPSLKFWWSAFYNELSHRGVTTKLINDPPKSMKQACSRTAFHKIRLENQNKIVQREYKTKHGWLIAHLFIQKIGSQDLSRAIFPVQLNFSGI